MERRVIIGLNKNNSENVVYIPNASEAALRTAMRMAPHRIVIYENTFAPYVLEKVKKIADDYVSKGVFEKNYFIFR